MDKNPMDKYVLLEREVLHEQHDSPGIGISLGHELSTGRAVTAKILNATTSDRRTAGVREVFEWEIEIVSNKLPSQRGAAAGRRQHSGRNHRGHGDGIRWGRLV